MADDKTEYSILSPSPPSYSEATNQETRDNTPPVPAHIYVSNGGASGGPSANHKFWEDLYKERKSTHVSLDQLKVPPKKYNLDELDSLANSLETYSNQILAKHGVPAASDNANQTPSISFEQGFKTAYKITPDTLDQNERQLTYEKTKNFLLAQMKKVSESNNCFKPEMRFNDAKFTIEIGHNYLDFLTLLENSPFKTAHFPSNDVHSSRTSIVRGGVTFFREELVTRSEDYKKLKILSTQPQEIKSKDGKVIAFNPCHSSFQTMLDQIQDNLRKAEATSQESTTPTNKNKVTLDAKTSKDSLIKNLAETQETPLRIVLGHIHESQPAKDMLINNLHYFKGGVLGLESFEYESHQKLLDAWMESTKDTPLPLMLKTRAELAGGMTDVLLKAKEVGVKRILAIDSDSASDSRLLLDNKRIEYMNYVSSRIIKAEVADNEKLFVFTGFLHASDITCTEKIEGKDSHTKTTEKKFGLTSLIPNVVSINMVPVKNNAPNLNDGISFKVDKTNQSNKKTFYAVSDIVLSDGSNNTGYSLEKKTTISSIPKGKNLPWTKTQEMSAIKNEAFVSLNGLLKRTHLTSPSTKTVLDSVNQHVLKNNLSNKKNQFNAFKDDRDCLIDNLDWVKERFQELSQNNTSQDANRLAVEHKIKTLETSIKSRLYDSETQKIAEIINANKEKLHADQKNSQRVMPNALMATIDTADVHTKLNNNSPNTKTKENHAALREGSSLTLETGSEQQKAKNSSPHTSKSLSQKGFDKSMTGLGVMGGINDIYRGNIANGAMNIGESSLEITSSFVNRVVNSKNVVTASGGIKTGSTALKVGGKFLKAVPFVGIAFSGYSAVSNAKNIYDHAQEGDTREIIKSSVNLLLDVGIVVSMFIPVVGPAISIGLVALQFFSDSFIDQFFDLEAYKKTWAILSDKDATFFEKVIAAPKGAAQMVISKTSEKILEVTSKITEGMNWKHQFFKDAKVEDFFKQSQNQDSFYLNFTGGAYSNHAGGVDLTIAQDAICFNWKSGTIKSNFDQDREYSYEKTLNFDRNTKKISITMSQGVTYDYKLHQKPTTKRTPNATTAEEVKLYNNSFTSTYNAADAEIDITFNAPTQNPAYLKDALVGSNLKDVLPADSNLGKGYDSFHYKINGGKGKNIYFLGQQNATISCGLGKNFIILPFDDTSSPRSLNIENFRGDGSCIFSLTNVLSDSELFKNAKIKRGEELNLKIGQTSVNIKPSGNLEKFFIRTNDAIVAFDFSDPSTHGIEYNVGDKIHSTYIGYNNIFQIKNPNKCLKEIKDLNGMIDFLKEMMENPYMYMGNNPTKNFSLEAFQIAKNAQEEINDISKKQKGEYIWKEFTNQYFGKKYQDWRKEYVTYSKDEIEKFNKESFRSIQGKVISFLKKHSDKNTYQGTFGKDVFMYNKEESGHKKIIGFEDGKDFINIKGLTNDEDVENVIAKAVQKDSDVFISFDEYNSITIENFQNSHLTPGNFVLGDMLCVP